MGGVGFIPEWLIPSWPHHHEHMAHTLPLLMMMITATVSPLLTYLIIITATVSQFFWRTYTPKKVVLLQLGIRHTAAVE